MTKKNIEKIRFRIESIEYFITHNQLKNIKDLG